MKLRSLPSKMQLGAKRVLVRVDWNAEDASKIERSIGTIKELRDRGAVVIVMTHLGRPKGREKKYSTERLVKIVQDEFKTRIHFIGDAIDTAAGLAKAQKTIESAKAGSVFLLENVRFLKGEETNSAALSKSIASLADIFVNDAFASCHRAHASVVGVANVLPSYAGPSLIAEVDALSPLLKKHKKPFVAIVGGAKLSTKMEILNALLRIADTVLVGGAMAHPFFVAQKISIGKSHIEKEGIPLAKKLLKNRKLVLPTDAVVAQKLADGAMARVVGISDVKKSDMIGDIGTETMREWARIVQKAKTILWNGPVGVAEIPTFSHGSLLLARAIASRSKGPCYGVVGGGDTLPVVTQSGMGEWIDHVSTGGGAMLEFLTKDGKLPGLVPLMGR